MNFGDGILNLSKETRQAGPKRLSQAPGFRSVLVEDSIRGSGIEHPNGPGFNLIRARAGKASADCSREVANTTKQ
jgi:hypothetical protein